MYLETIEIDLNDHLPHGAVVISEPHLKQLEEKLEHLHLRGKFYGEHGQTKEMFLGVIEELQKLTKAIRRSAE